MLQFYLEDPILHILENFIQDFILFFFIQDFRTLNHDVNTAS